MRTLKFKSELEDEIERKTRANCEDDLKKRLLFGTRARNRLHHDDEDETNSVTQEDEWQISSSDYYGDERGREGEN